MKRKLEASEFTGKKQKRCDVRDEKDNEKPHNQVWITLEKRAEDERIKADISALRVFDCDTNQAKIIGKGKQPVYASHLQGYCLKRQVFSAENILYFTQEALMLSITCSIPGVISCAGHCINIRTGQVTMLFPKAECDLFTFTGTMKQIPKQQQCFLKISLDVAKQLLTTLCFLHESGVLHGDIKNTNVLCFRQQQQQQQQQQNSDSDVRFVLSDMGNSFFCRPNGGVQISTDQFSTEYFSAPELIDNKIFCDQFTRRKQLGELQKALIFNQKTDVYALGILLLDLVSGVQTDIQILKKHTADYFAHFRARINDLQTDFETQNNVVGSWFCDLLRNMTRHAHNDRYTAMQALLMLDRITNTYEKKNTKPNNDAVADTKPDNDVVAADGAFEKNRYEANMAVTSQNKPIAMVTTPPAHENQYKIDEKVADVEQHNDISDKKTSTNSFSNQHSTVAKYFLTQLHLWKTNRSADRIIVHRRPRDQHIPKVQHLQGNQRWKQLERPPADEKLQIVQDDKLKESVHDEQKRHIARVVRQWIRDDCSYQKQLCSLIANSQRSDIIRLTDRLFTEFLMQQPVQVETVQEIAAASFLIACNAMYIWYEIWQFSILYPTNQLLDTIADICSLILI